MFKSSNDQWIHMTWRMFVTQTPQNFITANRRRRYASNIGVAFGIYDWSHHKSLEDLVTIPTKLSDNGLHHHGNQNYNIFGLTAEHEIGRRHSRPC